MNAGAHLGGNSMLITPSTTPHQIESGPTFATTNESLASADSYEWVKNCLYSLPRDCSDVTKAENLSLISMLGRPDNISKVLQEILDDKLLMSEIAKRSYH